MDESVLSRLAEVVHSRKPRPDRAAVAAGLIREATLARWVGIYTVADGLVSNEGWSGPGAPAHPTFPVTQGLTGRAVQVAAIAVSNDVQRDPRYLTNQDDSGSELIVPVVVAGQVVGTLDVESDAVGAFDGAEIARYELLARTIRPLWSNADADSVITVPS